MARLPKKNADYFPHSSGLRDDPRVKSLRRKYQHAGYSIYTMLRELVASADYFHLRVDAGGLEDIAGDLIEEPEFVSEIIGYCVERKLFQSIEIESIPFITDHQMIGDLTELLRKRGIKSNDLISGKYSSAIISATETQQSEHLNVESAQSKVNEKKVKEREEGQHINSNPNGKGENKSSAAPENPGAIAEKIAPGDSSMPDKPILDEFLSSTTQLEGFAMRARLSGLIRKQTTGPQAIERIRELASNYWWTFITEYPKGNLQKFVWRFGDYIKDLAAGKITEVNKPATTTGKLTYSITQTTTPLT